MSSLALLQPQKGTCLIWGVFAVSYLFSYWQSLYELTWCSFASSVCRSHWGRAPQALECRGTENLKNVTFQIFILIRSWAALLTMTFLILSSNIWHWSASPYKGVPSLVWLATLEACRQAPPWSPGVCLFSDVRELVLFWGNLKRFLSLFQNILLRGKDQRITWAFQASKKRTASSWPSSTAPNMPRGKAEPRGVGA